MRTKTSFYEQNLVFVRDATTWKGHTSVAILLNISSPFMQKGKEFILELNARITKLWQKWRPKTVPESSLGPFGSIWVSPLSKMGATGVPKSNILEAGCFKISKSLIPEKGVKDQHISSWVWCQEMWSCSKYWTLPSNCSIYKHFCGFL